MHRLSVVSVLCVLVLTAASVSVVNASPDAPQYVPERVGQFQEARDACNLLDVPLPRYLMDLVAYFASGGCHDALDHIDSAYDNAYLRAEAELTSPGFPTNDIHVWQGVLIQDFSGSEWGDGWGAIIAPAGADGPLPEGPQQPQYVGGGSWVAYKRAVYEQGIQPGYPINMEHEWNNVIIQDFRGGSWGDAAIIGGDNAWLVAGRHWEAYWRVDGSVRLGNPLGPVKQNAEGWYEQVFEGGQILELDHNIKVVFNDGSSAEELYIP